MIQIKIILTYSPVMRIIPPVSDDVLLLILTILLTDKSFQINLHNIHNLTPLYWEVKFCLPMF